MAVRLALILLFALPAFARTLHWKSFDVDARLDRDGNLHVSETQRMVFDGDWNGGERDFYTSGNQELEIHRIVRLDGTREVPLAEGDLEQVDQWQLTTGDVARWRSRLPSDPPFANQELTYRLDYTIRKLLLVDDTGKQFMLDHDFGLPERTAGAIERFTVRLTFDPVWRAEPVTIVRENNQPGEPVKVDIPLTYPAGMFPAGVDRPIAAWIPLAVLALFAIGL
ncbi:MAG TPA: DUF2207 domain-containing protein, partial [Thermoanaerobaculia bacterium]|nr:DUF2207 domain-containing protein [Thermoanaerobaculia bacterium]